MPVSQAAGASARTRLVDPAGAREVLVRLDAVDLSVAARATATAALVSAAELRAAVEDLDADRRHP